MNTKIVVITGRQIRQRVEDTLTQLNTPCQIIMAEYDNFSHIPMIYDRYAKEADGFLVSGEVALETIHRSKHTIYCPIQVFQSGPAEIYRAILMFLLDHPEGNMKRIALDFLLPLGELYTADAFVRQRQMEAMRQKTARWLHSLTWDELLGLEASIAQRLAEMWEREEMDVVVCVYSSIIPMLEQHGIPCKYPILSDVHLEELVRQLLVKIELNRLRGSLPAVVSAALYDKTQNTGENQQMLRRTLEVFFQERMLDCVVQEDAGCCNVLTTVEIMHTLTDHCETSQLSKYLEEHLPIPAAVGYGVGSSPSHALLNAQVARKEAESSGRSFIRNERGDLIGPLGTHLRLVVEHQSVRDVGELAKRCGLATLTIQKVAASAKLSGSNRITTQELAHRLGVTVRNANRILGSMAEGGAARVILEQTSKSRGRPVKVYELTFDALS